MCHNDRDMEMSNSEEIKNSSQSQCSKDNFETPQRKRYRLQENKSENGADIDHHRSDYKLISDSKTAPIVVPRHHDMMVDDEFTEAKKYFTERKVKKSIKIGHLNSLSAAIGEVGYDNPVDMYPEIIFHSPN